jgi:hypothetical protein
VNQAILFSTTFLLQKVNKNLLLIAAAAAAYALLRPKTTVASTTASASAGTAPNANTYMQQQAAAGTAPAAGNPAGGWLNTAGNIITGATGLVQQGATAWGDITGALGIKPPVKPAAASPTASITAEGDAGIWAGPNYQTSVWAGPKYEDS